MSKQIQKKFTILTAFLLFNTYNIKAQELHSRWDELTASEWPKALEKSNQTCILPIGILEKHGPHVPVGADLIGARNESGANQKRLNIPDVYTAIGWYADFPNHYAGEGTRATRELGQLAEEHLVGSFVTAIKAIKADTKTLELQKEFFDRVKKE